jgi:hypothetical protein
LIQPNREILDKYLNVSPNSLTIRELQSFVREINDEYLDSIESLVDQLTKLLIDRNAFTHRYNLEWSPINDTVNIHQDTDHDLENKIKAYEERLKAELNQEQEVKKYIGFVSDVQNKAKDIKIVLDKIISERLIVLIEPIKETIIEVMNCYLKDEGKGISIDFSVPDLTEDTNSKGLSIMLKYNESGTVTDPSKYFNTYRYKLFCYVCRMGLLIAYRKHYKVNLPIVIDDAFYSSDYVNIVLFEETMKKILSILGKYISDAPLQLILFTHDIHIFNSVSNALQRVDTETILMRLFSFTEAQDSRNYRNLGYKLERIPDSSSRIVVN